MANNHIGQVRKPEPKTAHDRGRSASRAALQTSPLLANGVVALRRTGLAFSQMIPLREWELIGQQILAVADSSTWWVGDWLCYGEQAYQDRYREAVQMTSLNYQTLRNYAWVARRLELSRRRDSLSFGHHAEVAALDVPEQDYWLRKAEELRWSRNQLRAEVRASLKQRRLGDPAAPGVPAAPLGGGRGETAEPPPAASGTEILCLRFSSTQFARLSAVACGQNLTVDEWAIQAIRDAVIAATAVGLG